MFFFRFADDLIDFLLGLGADRCGSMVLDHASGMFHSSFVQTGLALGHPTLVGLAIHQAGRHEIPEMSIRGRMG